MAKIRIIVENEHRKQKHYLCAEVREATRVHFPHIKKLKIRGWWFIFARDADAFRRQQRNQGKILIGGQATLGQKLQRLRCFMRIL